MVIIGWGKFKGKGPQAVDQICMFNCKTGVEFEYVPELFHGGWASGHRFSDKAVQILCLDSLKNRPKEVGFAFEMPVEGAARYVRSPGNVIDSGAVITPTSKKLGCRLKYPFAAGLLFLIRILSAPDQIPRMPTVSWLL